MKLSARFVFIVYFFFLCFTNICQAQDGESIRIKNWFTLQKLLNTKATAPWLLSPGDVQIIEQLQTNSLSNACVALQIFPCSLIALPVTGLVLKGSRINNQQALLYWETISEYNSLGFVLERQSSYNAAIFDSVIFVQGAGTSYSKRKYQDADFNNNQNNTLYRVKEIDKDGNYTYSNTVVIDGAQGAFGLMVSPNPARSNNLRFYFTVPSSVQSVSFSIFNAAGVELIRKENILLVPAFTSCIMVLFPLGFIILNYLLLQRFIQNLL